MTIYQNLSKCRISLKKSGYKIIFPQLHSAFVAWITTVVFVAAYLELGNMGQSSFKNYLHSLKWSPLPIGVGLALIAFQRYQHTRKREAARIGTLAPCECLANEWEIHAYKLLPLHSLSRAFGWLTQLELPEWSRQTVLGLYVNSFDCNMSEAEIEDLAKYRCLSELFRRSLKKGVRPVDESASVVSPADGRVFSFGTINCGNLEQIKGVKYSIQKFLGPNYWKLGGPVVVENEDDECYHQACLTCKDTELYYCIIYLAPGDYHRFHSPAEWTVSFRRHFAGELLSVNPSIASWIRELFVLNERVGYTGLWKYGFFNMTAVGATIVGSVRVYFDEHLKTNCRKLRKGLFLDTYFDKNIPMAKGSEFGEFNLGSSVVLIFEAPKKAKVCIEPGQKVRVGQALFKVEE